MAITPEDRKISQMAEVAPSAGMFVPLVDLTQIPPAQNVRASVGSILALINIGAYVPTSRAINTSGSLTGGGDLSADRSLSLTNDNAAPGNSQYYGTDGAGTKGFFPLPAAGTGTVTSFSSGNLSPLFTTNVATATTTPALTFSLSTQSANLVFAGPTAGGAAGPTFRLLVAADIPDLSGVYQPLDADLTALAALATTGLVTRTGAGTFATRTVTAGTNISITNGDGVAGNPTLNVPDSSEILRGAIELATQAETDTGIDDLRAVTPLKLKTTSFLSSKILVDRLAGSTYSTVQDYINTMTSPGTILGGELSTISATDVRVAQGRGMVRIADDNVSSLPFFNWAQTDFTVPNDDNPRYFGVVYNAGTPIVEMRTAFNWNFDTEIPLGAALRNTAGSIFVFVNRPYRTGDAMTNVIQRFDSIAPVQRDNDVGGLLISEVGTRNIAVTAGKIWLRLNDFDQPAIDTSAASTMVTAYYNGAAWVYTPGVTQWPNTQYNDITTGLVAITGSRYVNLWFYLGASGGGLRMVYGQAQYNQLSDALAESEPVFFPTNLHPFLLLIGKLTFQNGGAVAESLISPFTGANLGGAGGGAISNHNQLSGLQGGTTNEYYHLTQAAYNNISAGTTATPEFARLGLGGPVDSSLALKITGVSQNVLLDNFAGQTGLLVRATGTSTTARLRLENDLATSTANVAMLDLALKTTVSTRSVAQVDTILTDNTDATRTSIMRFSTCVAGALSERARIGEAGNFLVGTIADVAGPGRIKALGIEDTPIGATTPNTGSFTDVTMTVNGSTPTANRGAFRSVLNGTDGSSWGFLSASTIASGGGTSSLNAEAGTDRANATRIRLVAEPLASRTNLISDATGTATAFPLVITAPTSISMVVGASTVGIFTSTGINSTAIGATTPSTVACTTLIVNGKAVTEGAVDSGGTGFRVLRVPN